MKFKGLESFTNSFNIVLHRTLYKKKEVSNLTKYTAEGNA